MNVKFMKEILDAVNSLIRSELPFTYEPAALLYIIPRHVRHGHGNSIVILFQWYENLGQGQWQHCTKSNIVCCEVARRSDRDSSP